MKLKKIRSDSLFTRLLIRFIVISLIIVVVLGTSLIYFFKSFYFNKSEEDIVNNTNIVINDLGDAFVYGDLELAIKGLELISLLNEGQTWLIDKDGYLILSYPSPIALNRDKIRFKDVEKIQEGNIISQRIESPYFERPMLLVGVPIYDSQGQLDNKSLLIFTSVAGINSTINQVRRMMIYSSILAIFLAILISYRWSKSLSAPLKEISDTAIEISKGNLDHQIVIEDNTEVGMLADSMNYLSEKLKVTLNDLIREKNKLQYVLSGMEEGVLFINKRSRVILLNNSIKRLFNIDKEEVVHLKLDQLLKEDQVKNIFKESLKERKGYKKEVTIRRGGDEFRILINCTPIYINNGKMLGIVGLFQDISQRWHFERLQRDFVANVSHELKTPLSSIKGSAEVLLDKVVDTPKRRDNYLRIILEEVNRLTYLVDQILDLSELNQNNFNFDFEKIEANNLLKDIKDIFEKVIMDSDRLKVNLSVNDICILGNKEKLKQVLLNFLDNADKYSKGKGQIEIGVELQGSKVRFWVKDQGIGISKEELKLIWERFYKVDRARTPNANEGSGLGLSIVKEIISEHRGEVFVESQLGVGSTFGFELDSIND
ncbi:ATP-binding protein [Halonatronum saccharophilum]|uniref:ATP-binding protein n=1 Tax=Halonatronum saccharophilum TaxID=150060 RepID=UPI00048465C5|nr:ATP-binding protein [Halonatronum saccharophilum]